MYRPMTSSSVHLVSVVSEIHPQLYMMVMRIVGNRADAEDVIQDTCARLLSPQVAFSGLLSPRAHVMTVARHAAFDHMRKRGAPKEQGSVLLAADDGCLTTRRTWNSTLSMSSVSLCAPFKHCRRVRVRSSRCAKSTVMISVISRGGWRWRAGQSSAFTIAVSKE